MLTLNYRFNSELLFQQKQEHVYAELLFQQKQEPVYAEYVSQILFAT